MQPELPRIPDSTLAFLREGYTFVSSRCDALETDAFQTRIMLRPVVCMRGADAAALFYNEELFGRYAALPRSAQHLLEDEGSVQTLTGSSHHHRKDLFVSLLGELPVRRLGKLFAQEWEAAVPEWSHQPRFVLHTELMDVLTRTACRWAGLSVEPKTMKKRSEEFALMIDRAGSVGPANWYARRRRATAEQWAAEQIRHLRDDPDRDGPAAAIARFRDDDGELLPERVGAVELLNLLRPIVAVGRLMTFAVLALVQHPQWRPRLAEGTEEDVLAFAQEVRRYYPFYPVAGGMARSTFEWGGHTFASGQWALLDLYGTNHDPRVWEDPESFQPDRFRGRAPDPNTLIPQGGGDVRSGHRCPGESATLELLRVAARLVARRDDLRVPAQDFTVDLARIPALPRSGLALSIARGWGT